MPCRIDSKGRERPWRLDGSVGDDPCRSEVTPVNFQTGTEAGCWVVHAERCSPEVVRVALEFLDPYDRFWPIDFPSTERKLDTAAKSVRNGQNMASLQREIATLLARAFMAAVTIMALAPSRGARLVAQDAPPSTEHSEALRGTVVNSLTREPIGRALVLSPDNRFAVMTDDQGRFELTIPGMKRETGAGQSGGELGVQYSFLANRPTMLIARKPGFLDLQPGQQGVLIGPERLEVTIPLVPEALIVGRVLTPNSECERIQVELYRQEMREGEWYWHFAGWTATRMNGEFRFAELPAGKYKLLTLEMMDRDPLTTDPRGPLFGYAPAYYPAARDFGSAEIISLAEGKTFHANLTPVRQRYHPVKVRVTNPPDGLGINVQAWPEGNSGPGYTLGLGYDSGDEIIQGMLPDGNYEIRAVAHGHTVMTGTTRISIHGAPSMGAITLLASVSIRVKVREEFQHGLTSGQALVSNEGLNQVLSPPLARYLSVRLLPSGEFGFEGFESFGRPPSSEKAMEDGSLLIENVQPGRYRLKVTSVVGYVGSVTSNEKSLRNELLEVGPGGPVAPIEVTIRDDGAEVEGTVQRAKSGTLQHNGARVSGLLPSHVYFIPVRDSTGQFRTAWASLDGRFQLQQLPPGDYRVLAFDHVREDLEYASDEVLSRYDSQSQMIHVDPGQKEHLQLLLVTEPE